MVLAVIAWLLIPLMTLINLRVVNRRNGDIKGYFRNTALSIDIWGCREFRASWNYYLIPCNGYKFGVHGESISSAIGKNIQKGFEIERRRILTGFYINKWRLRRRYHVYKKYTSLTKIGNRLNFCLDVFFNEPNHALNSINENV